MKNKIFLSKLEEISTVKTQIFPLRNSASFKKVGSILNVIRTENTVYWKIGPICIHPQSKNSGSLSQGPPPQLFPKNQISEFHYFDPGNRFYESKNDFEASIFGGLSRLFNPKIAFENWSSRRKLANSP